MTRKLSWITVAVVTIVLAYVGLGSWWAARILDSTLTVGAATAQNSGWPTPKTPADIGYEGDPQAAYGYSFENVVLSGDLGTFPAWLIPSDSPQAPWAIFIHGIGGRRENGYRFLPALHEAGLPVLMISYRNDKDAPADPSGMYAFGLTEWRDLDTAVHYAMDRGAPSVLIVAESMGGGIAGQFLRHSAFAKAVSGLVLDAPAIDFPSILTGQLVAMKLPLASTLASGALWVSSLSRPIRLGDADTSAEFAAFPHPMFLSHGSADRVVPVGSSDELVSRRGQQTIYLRTKADHIQSWIADPVLYDSSLAAFLAMLKGRPGAAPE